MWPKATFCFGLRQAHLVDIILEKQNKKAFKKDVIGQFGHGQFAAPAKFIKE